MNTFSSWSVSNYYAWSVRMLYCVALYLKRETNLMFIKTYRCINSRKNKIKLILDDSKFYLKSLLQERFGDKIRTVEELRNIWLICQKFIFVIGRLDCHLWECFTRKQLSKFIANSLACYGIVINKLGKIVDDEQQNDNYMTFNSNHLSLHTTVQHVLQLTLLCFF